MADHLHALRPGTLVDGYEIVSVLGSGGFGITYLARDVALDKPVAIKEYMPSDLAVRQQTLTVSPKSGQDKADFDWGLDRFLDEARTLARFDHPNVVKVSRFFRAHGTAYIVMEHVSGETLSEVLKRKGRLGEAELRGLVEGLLSGLEAVHAADYLHRDIKPGNVILRPDGTPVLLDFGSARQSVTAKSRSVTAIVTPGYAPIEQYSSRGNQGPWTDIYAVGAICYRAMTGEVPVDATERVRRDPLVPASEHAVSKGAYSPALLAAVDEALRVDEDARPQSVAAWRALLSSEAAPTEKLAPAMPAGPNPSPAQKDSSQAGRGGLVAAAVFAAALGASGVAVLLSAQGGQGTQPDAAPGPAAVTAPEVPSVAGLHDTMAAPSLAQEETAPQPSLPETGATRRVRDVFRDGFTSGSGEGPEMVVLPAGSVSMGPPRSTPWSDHIYGPQRTVSIEYRLAVSKFPITVGEYRIFSKETMRSPAQRCRAYFDVELSRWVGSTAKNWEDPGFFQAEDHPVTCVSWYDAKAYVKWLNEKTGLNGGQSPYRLLSQPEWEYAARGGTTTNYSWGVSDVRTYANFGSDVCCSGLVSGKDYWEHTSPVGMFPSNNFGVHDMHGNVWEWLQDCDHPFDMGMHFEMEWPTDGSAFDHDECYYRAARGGSWLNMPESIDSSAFISLAPISAENGIGFRVARTIR